MKHLLALFISASLFFAPFNVAEQISVKIEGTRGVYTLPADFYGKELTKRLDNRLDLFVDGVYKSEYVAPIDAKFYYDQNSAAVKIKPESFGREIDKEKLKGLIIDALEAGGGYIKAPKKQIEPKVFYKDLSGATSLRASFTTYYVTEKVERASNICLATDAISGTVLMPGDSFSFNAVVGERTEKRGYKIAKVIQGGNFVDGIGGGVCQVSTTLFNAVLLSGLKVTEVHRHTLSVDYVKKSFDAMVSFNFADLRFVNTTSAPVLIVGWAKNGALKFSVYGQKMQDKISLESVVTKIIEPKTSVIYNQSLDSGQTRVVISPKRGYESQGYMIIKSGDSLQKILLSRDSYKCVDGVIETGGE